jgi:hypothetical protein
MAGKLFVSLGDFYTDSVLLARKIKESGFRPDYLIGLWRGGAFPGCIVQEALDFWGIPTDHIAIRTSGYNREDKHKAKVDIFGLSYITKRVKKDDKILIVDDVFDTGLSIKALIEKLKADSGENCPKEIKTAMLYYKPENNETSITPDYYIHETDKWLVFPHEFKGLTKEEIESGKGQSVLRMLF